MPKSLLDAPESKSRPNRPRPYDKLKKLAEELSNGLELEATHCEFRPERERLRVLRDVARKVSECLVGLGVR
jgi:hypothetical protein